MFSKINQNISDFNENQIYTLARYMNDFYKNENSDYILNCNYIFQYFVNKHYFQIQLYKLNYINFNISFSNSEYCQIIHYYIKNFINDKNLNEIIIDNIQEYNHKYIIDFYININEIYNNDYIHFINHIFCITNINSNYDEIIEAYEKKIKTYIKLDNLYFENINANKEYIFFDIISYNKYKLDINYNLFKKFKMLIYEDQNFNVNVDKINNELYYIYINFNTKYLCYK